MIKNAAALGTLYIFQSIGWDLDPELDWHQHLKCKPDPNRYQNNADPQHIIVG